MAGINTLNESALHKSLKALYAARTGGSTEQKVGSWICDVVSGASVIEIQTGSLGALKKKCLSLLESGYSVTVVAPLAAQKTIRTLCKDKAASRKSPKKENLYSFARNLAGLREVLLLPNFSLEVPIISMTEERVRTEEPVQSPNLRRRRKKAWLKTNKFLDSIIETRTFRCAGDYAALLPQGLAAQFTAADIRAALLSQGERISADHASVFCWLMERLGVIAPAGRRGRARVFARGGSD